MDIPENAYTSTMQIRFKDTDQAGHVNHATFVTYLETARINWIKEEASETGMVNIPLIIAKVEIDYLKPILIDHEPTVSLWVSRIGTKSFDFEYCIHDETQQFAVARTVLVYFDYSNHKSIPIPDEIRELLEQFVPQ